MLQHIMGICGQVLTADAAEAFAEAPEGFYDKILAEKLVTYLFRAQNTMDPEDAYKKFRAEMLILKPYFEIEDF